MDISVIIPFLNEEESLPELISWIERVMQANQFSYEVIMIDDGSTDNTESVVAGFADKRVKYFKKANKERGAARNFGVKNAHARYVTFCDSDDLLYPNYLQNAFETITSSNVDIPWLHLSYEIKKNGGKSIKMTVKPSDLILTLAKGNPLSCMGVFIKKEIIANNLFNEDRYLSGSEDWELWLRLAAKYPIVVDTRVSSCLLLHDGRSVLASDELKLQLRKYLSIGYAFDDEYVKATFAKYRNLMEAYFDTYISLHLMLSGNKISSIRYLLNAFLNYPACVFDRRFLAIIKYWFISI